MKERKGKGVWNSSLRFHKLSKNCPKIKIINPHNF